MMHNSESTIAAPPSGASRVESVTGQSSGMLGLGISSGEPSGQETLATPIMAGQVTPIAGLAAAKLMSSGSLTWSLEVALIVLRRLSGNTDALPASLVTLSRILSCHRDNKLCTCLKKKK